MSRKIKLHSLHFLFRIFSFLADKSGGWKLFVKPKLIIGSLILGFGFTACNTKSNNSGNQNSKSTEIIDSIDSQTGKNNADNQNNDTIPDSLVVSVSCYLVGNDVNDYSSNDPNKIYDVIEHMPQYPGGDKALYRYLSSAIKYPKSAIKNKYQGRVIVRFVVDKKGSIGQIAVVRSIEPSLDKEAVRIISSMPKWIPGKQNGVNVNVWFTLPINFKLQ